MSFLSNHKENVTFTWSAGVQNILFLTITGDKFIVYVPTIDIDILTPFSSLYILWLHLRMYMATVGC